MLNLTSSPRVSTSADFRQLRARTEVPATDVNYIAIDSIYTPIVNVNPIRENYRVDQKTDYEK